MLSFCRYALLVIIMLFSQPALACQALPVNDPEEITQLIEKASTEGQGVTEEEVAKIKAYQRDLERFHVLYNKLYPCVTLPGDIVELSSEERSAYRTEWKALDKKWGFMD